jgi:adenylyltransferase/sulfurtransferase
MAMETIKEIIDAGESMAGRIWIYDALTAKERTLKLNADPQCPLCG